jgi:hypothetical protein
MAFPAKQPILGTQDQLSIACGLGPPLALSLGMSILPHIRRYRELAESFDNGNNLGMTDVLSMEQLGALLRRQAEASAGPTITAILTSGKEEHRVELQALGPDQVICTDCPRVLPGATLGLRLDDASDDASYLFRAAVTSGSYNSATKRWTLGLALIGSPVVLNWGCGRAASSDVVLRLEESLNAA